MTTGKLTSGKSDVARRENAMNPSTMSAAVTITVKTGRRMAMAERFIVRSSLDRPRGSALLDDVDRLTVADVGARRDEDEVVRAHAALNDERAVLVERERDLRHASDLLA